MVRGPQVSLWGGTTKQLSSSVPKKQHFAASVLNSAGVGAEVGQEAMSGQRALKRGVGGPTGLALHSLPVSVQGGPAPRPAAEGICITHLHLKGSPRLATPGASAGLGFPQ